MWLPRSLTARRTLLIASFILWVGGTFGYGSLLRRDPFADGVAWVLFALCVFAAFLHGVTPCVHCGKSMFMRDGYGNPLRNRCLHCNRTPWDKGPTP